MAKQINKELEERERRLKMKMLDAMETVLDETIRATKMLGEIVNNDINEEARIEAARVLLSKLFADRKDDGKVGMQTVDYSIIEEFVKSVKGNS